MEQISDNSLYWAKIKEDAIIPTKKDEDAGYDIYACFDDDFIRINLCPPRKNGHKKASKNEMNRRISLVYENQPHLFHGLLDNEPLPA